MSTYLFFGLLADLFLFVLGLILGRMNYNNISQSKIMFSKTQITYFLNLLAIAAVSIYLFRTSNIPNLLEQELYYAKLTGQRFFSCQQLCHSYPYASISRNQCCIGNKEHPCQSKSIYFNNYIQSKQDQLTALYRKMVIYTISIVMLSSICLLNCCSDCRSRSQSQHPPYLQESHQDERSIFKQSQDLQDRTKNCALCLVAYQGQKWLSLNYLNLFHGGCIEWVRNGDKSCNAYRLPQGIE